MFHGLADPYLLPAALNDTWKWVERDLTLTTIPEADHWVHHDTSELVTKRMVWWLSANQKMARLRGFGNEARQGGGSHAGSLVPSCLTTVIDYRHFDFRPAAPAHSQGLAA